MGRIVLGNNLNNDSKIPEVKSAGSTSNGLKDWLTDLDAKLSSVQNQLDLNKEILDKRLEHIVGKDELKNHKELIAANQHELHKKLEKHQEDNMNLISDYKILIKNNVNKEIDDIRKELNKIVISTRTDLSQALGNNFSDIRSEIDKIEDRIKKLEDIKPIKTNKWAPYVYIALTSLLTALLTTLF